MAPQLSEEYLELEKGLGFRPCLKGTVEEIQQTFDAMMASLADQLPPPSDAVTARDEKAEGVPVRIYTPKNASEKLPIAMYTHGGGWVLGSLDTEDLLCRTVAEHTPCIVVSVNYRHGPQNKWPTMLDDCVTAFKWARKNASELGGDQSKIFTIGNSAGGNLAITTTNKLVEDSSTRDYVRGVVANVPVTIHPDHVPAEYKSMYKSYGECATDTPMIDASSMHTFFDAIDTDGKDPYQFPALSKNLSHFPPTYIVTCGADPLRDDGMIMEELLKKAGVKTKSDTYPGMPHVFWAFPGLPSGQLFVQNLIGGIHFVLQS